MDLRIQKLINHFGTQQKAAVALGVDQTTISGWLRGKHSISPANALRIQIATSGAIQAADVCSVLADLAPTLKQMVPANSHQRNSTEAAVNPSSAGGAQ
ncbi:MULTISPECIES: Cro/CI family transcriptional regulator [Pseudomonas]|jgi:DNA-binding transcriptional regulator YdaS (Cro superfamily)|uniref:Cro/CI family transcriptional regulator n=1 Tax=Pseudomonas TaxID=286 RepID=UPI0009E7B692|nr:MULTISPECIES: Cro/CI family transcriptional regulator [Pseudomonas]MCE0756528.1 helix-turn-helix domain-containing protein [Pseudomonas asiatica]MCE0944427.1 helix-turn-helix domain-containing protein [Pseudomonas asiatica]MCE1031997.1 helix-turn-helix domain-containing protein [Pseudomonas asiatica]MCE1066219.1 helix-turn-helix domain-containing protein [Pseudomonas asiatica]MCE1101458.1 helix-turn-helix domain-containing protein [Pseudomonas asiatica]